MGRRLEAVSGGPMRSCSNLSSFFFLKWSRRVFRVVIATFLEGTVSSSSLCVVVSCLSCSSECSARTRGGRGWKISEKERGVGLPRLGFTLGRGVVKGLGSGGNLTLLAPTLDRGVTLSTLSRAWSIDVPLLSVSKISLNVDLSTLRPKPAGVVGGTERETEIDTIEIHKLFKPSFS